MITSEVKVRHNVEEASLREPTTWDWRRQPLKGGGFPGEPAVRACSRRADDARLLVMKAVDGEPRRSRRPRFIVVLAAVAAVFFISGCKRPPSDSSAASDKDALNVLVLTLDTTRADHLGCYGHAEAGTPTLDHLAQTGVRFESAYCQVPLTLPSHVSLFTGTYPPAHGIRVNGGGALREDLPTLAEAFQAHGYCTAAFIGAAVLDSAFGLGRGFDVYDDNLWDEASGPTGAAERRANQVCDTALAWLDQHRGRPFFAWVHFFDPHDPYDPPPEFRERYSEPYDGEIAFMDTQVGRLMDWLEARGLRNRTLIVVVGDHGEAFGEHREIQHGMFVYDTTMRVPFILSLPGRLPQGQVVSAGVRLVDVMPTVLDLMDWELHPGLAGHSLRSGVETGEFPPLPAYGESYYPRMAFGWSALRCYITQQWKYIAAPRAELYERKADPEELKNVIAEHPDVSERLKGELERLLAAMSVHQPRAMVLDEETARALESLGYVGVSSAGSKDGEQPGRDPKDMVDVFLSQARARAMIREGHHAEALPIVESLVARSRESDELYALLGRIFLKLGRFAEAEQALRTSLRNVSADPQRLCHLAQALWEQRKLDEAVACYEQALAAVPDYGHAHKGLGFVRFRQGRFLEAHDHFRRFLELYPNSPEAMAEMGSVLYKLQRPRRAVRYLRQALEQDPAFGPAHRLLWRVLADVGDRVAAIGALRKACQLLPDDRIMLQRTLAWLLATTPEAGANAPQEAIHLAQECCAAQPDEAGNHDVLGMAYAASGDFLRAVEATQRALTLAQSQGRRELAEKIARRLEAYQAGRTH
jgi:arylsulfatase A-like enzyme/Flp pilus assembly protein TadD